MHWKRRLETKRYQARLPGRIFHDMFLKSLVVGMIPMTVNERRISVLSAWTFPVISKFSIPRGFPKAPTISFPIPVYRRYPKNSMVMLIHSRSFPLNGRVARSMIELTAKPITPFTEDMIGFGSLSFIPMFPSSISSFLTTSSCFVSISRWIWVSTLMFVDTCSVRARKLQNV